MKGYKGFSKELKCRDMQYEIGKTYETKKAELCKTGFHFCEHPLNCFNYYPPAESRYCEIEADEVSDKTYGDTKRVAKKLTIGIELNVKGLVDAAVKFVFDKADWSKKESSATGDLGAASATGDQGAASATGYQGAASATGDQGAASATGDRGAASATGDLGAASATGYRGAASATGYQGAASATGNQTIAHADGVESKASGSIGNWLTLSEWGYNTDGKWIRIACLAVQVDGEIIKADTFYSLIDGNPKEV